MDQPTSEALVRVIAVIHSMSHGAEKAITYGGRSSLAKNRVGRLVQPLDDFGRGSPPQPTRGIATESLSHAQSRAAGYR